MGTMICGRSLAGNHGCLEAFTHRPTGLLVAAAFLEPANRNGSNEFWSRRSYTGMWGLHHTLRWDDRQYKKSSHLTFSDAALDVQMTHGASTSKWNVSDDYDPCTSERCVTAEMVSKLCEQGHLMEAVESLGILVQIGCAISQSVFYTVLKRCGAQKDLVLGRRVHALSVETGYESETFLCNHIVRMYASLAKLQEAVDVFTLVAEPDAFLWSSIISAHVNHGQAKQAIELYHRMRTSSVKPDGHVFVAALQACARGADLKTGQEVHAAALASGLELDVFICNSLVDMYAKCGSLDDARRVFDGLGRKNVVTWNAMIAGYAQQGLGLEALRLYSAMQKEVMAVPTSVTFLCVLQACAVVGTPALEQGRQLHAEIRKQGLLADVVVGCSLVNMYAKCGCLESAQRVFDGLPQRDVVTWTSLIAGYSQQGMGQEALRLYSIMQEEGMTAPNSVTFLSLLQACATVGTPALEKGKQLHAHIRDKGYQADVFVANSLVNMYAKCGSLEDAQIIFDGLPRKDSVTWNAMIAGYSQQGLEQEALRLYSAMQEEGIVAPDSATFVCLLQACANVAALHMGRQLHAQVEEQGLQADVLVAVSLMNMYAKSGSMVDAQRLFEALPKRDIVAWNVLIAGYTRQADNEAVFDLFHRMREDGIQPASITFLSVLTVCSHTGLMNEGRELFEAMSEQYGITPTADHYTCMVDLLGRAGQLEEALALVRTMPVLPDAAVWHTLMGACQKWRNVEVGRHAFHEVLKLDKGNAVAYVLMSNIYTSAQMSEKAQEMQAMRTAIGAWKEPGHSWWTDMEGLVHSFLVGYKEHPESAGIYEMLEQLVLQAKLEGYAPLEVGGYD